MKLSNCRAVMQCVVIAAALLKNLVLAGMCITITVYKLEEYMEKGKKRWKKSFGVV